MIKIKYPEKISDFKNEYLKIFNVATLDAEWQQYTSTYNLQNANFSVTDMLYGDFDFLLEKSLSIVYDTSDCNSSNKVKLYELKKIFDYNEHQPKIADFFMRYKDEMKLSTCYYCNIDYINAFTAYSHKDELDFINNANETLFSNLSKVGKATFEKINAQRPFSSIVDFETKLSSEAICKLSDIVKAIQEQQYPQYVHKNHFTLDHVIDKATNPIVALSLFNFVPSCYSCNSKFKKSEQFTKVVADKYKSPTDANFDFNKDVKLRVLYASRKNSLDINSIDDFEINFDDSKHLFEDYIKIFKLKERYRFHKNIALELLTKKKNYSDSRVDEISRIIGMPKEEIKKDLFGKEIFEGDLQEKPFTKLKRDIYV